MAWLAAAGCVGLCAGCASTIREPEALAAPTSDLYAAAVFPDAPQHKVYDAVEPGGAFIIRDLTPAEPASVAAAGGSGGEVEIPEIVSLLEVRSRIFAAGADVESDAPIEDRFLVLGRCEGGAVVLISSLEGGRVTTFEPPIVYMPAVLRPGEVVEFESRAVVRDENGRQQTSGRAVRRVEYVGDAQHAAAADAPMPAGAERVVHASLDVDLFPARVVSQTRFVIDGRGIVAERQTTRVRVLGVPAETRRHDVTLRTGPVEAGEPGAQP